MKIRRYLPLLALLVCGCAYFNTYYNAQKFFNQAEDIRKRGEAELKTGTDMSVGKSSSELYDKAIKKASAVLEFYPRSRWVDDSLFLLGQAFYWQGDYQKAEIKFQELETNFPKSSLLPEARYWRGLCFWKLKEFNQAREILTPIAEQKLGKISGSSFFTLGEMEFEEEDYREALDFYTRVIHHRSVLKDLKAQAWKKIGECYFILKDYDRAIEEFKQMLAMSPSSTLQYMARNKIGECLQAQHRYSDAMTIYQDLLKKEQFRPFFPRLSLNVAECYARIGKIEQALNTYDEITHSAPNTEEAALALYEMGELYQVHFNNLQKAKELFEQTQKIGGRFEVVRLAQKRINDIALLDHYRSVLPVYGDSVAATQSNGDSVAAAQFHMGELYWFTFEQADSALAAYRAVVERFPESDWAPKALYAVGWLHERLADTTGAAATYQELIDRYSDTEYADTARVRLGMDTKIDEAKRLFLKAETIRLSGAKPDSYLPLFEEVMKSEPKSSYAAKALYVIGWTYESLLGDSTKAIERYKRLLEDFPTSDLSIAARRRIDLQRHAPTLQTLPATPDSVVVSLDRRKTGDMNDNGTPPDSTAPPDHMHEEDTVVADSIKVVADSLDIQ